MIKKLLLTTVVIGVAGLAGFAIYAYEPELKPVSRPDPSSFAKETVDKGRVLAAAGYCATCHTSSDGAPYAGNYAMKTGFGTIYSTNITPDEETGIGTWSEEAFIRAMRHGVDREGNYLFPAFPYTHFAKMSDEDIKALYAYLMTDVEPVKATHDKNELPFPLNQRYLQAGWQLLFADTHPYEPDSSQGADWNRGAYLVEGLTHCGACHTPRNPFGAEKDDERFAGAKIDNWVAPALTNANASGVPWTAKDYASYLKNGYTTYQGSAAGPMSPVVHAGIAQLPDSDIAAMGIYLASLNSEPKNDPATSEAVIASLKAGAPDKNYRLEEGQRLYTTACAACHYNADQVKAGRPDLGINSAVRIDDPTNLIHVILNGIDAQAGIPGVVMPGFRNAMSDDEIAKLAAYLRASRTSEPEWKDLSQKVSEIRALSTAESH